jgi:hypothetical protein
MLKGIMKGLEDSSNTEIEEVIASAWNGLTFNDVQSVFGSYISCPVWVIKNYEKNTLESIKNSFLAFNECENRRGPGRFYILNFMR